MDTQTARVLAIDDDPSACTLYRQVLGGRGFAVEICDHGTRAMLALARRTYDLVLLNPHTPGVGGIDILALAGRQLTPAAFVVTGEPPASDAPAQPGSWGGLYKPSTAIDVWRVVEQALADRHARALPAGHPPPTGDWAPGELDLPQLYQHMVRIAMVKLRADRSSLLLWGEGSDRVTVAASAGLPFARPGGTSAALRTSVSGWVIRYAEPLLLRPGSSVPPELQAVARSERSVSSGICVPLVAQGRVLGALTATRCHGRPLFTPADLEVLLLLAGQVVAVLEEAQTQRRIQRLAQREKLAGLARLTAALAHEINNPLQALQTTLHLLLNRSLAEEKRERMLSMAQIEVDRLAALVRRMLDLHRPVHEDMRPISIHGLLESALAATAPHFQQHHVLIERDWANELLWVLGIGGHLKQVFQDLATNAVEAMPDGGRLKVRTRLENGAGGEPAPQVLVEFADSGPGISEGEVNLIFEPFHTTKRTNAGLGLAISYGIVERHGGLLSVSSTGDGTTFRVLLPAAMPLVGWLEQ